MARTGNLARRVSRLARSQPEVGVAQVDPKRARRGIRRTRTRRCLLRLWRNLLGEVSGDLGSDPGPEDRSHRARGCSGRGVWRRQLPDADWWQAFAEGI